MKELEDSSFEGEVLGSDLPVLVDFWAPWCGPCLAMTPILEDLSAVYKGRVDVVKVNVDKNPEASATYSISSIPTLIIFKGGVEVYRMVGARSKAAMCGSIDGVLQRDAT